MNGSIRYQYIIRYSPEVSSKIRLGQHSRADSRHADAEEAAVKPEEEAGDAEKPGPFANGVAGDHADEAAASAREDVKLDDGETEAATTREGAKTDSGLAGVYLRLLRCTENSALLRLYWRRYSGEG